MGGGYIPPAKQSKYEGLEHLQFINRASLLQSHTGGMGGGYIPPAKQSKYEELVGLQF